MTFLSVLATVFGAVSGLANFPQAYKIFKRKSAKDISIITYSVVFIAGIVWLFYGIEIKNAAIIVLNSLVILNVGLVLIGWFKYGR